MNTYNSLLEDGWRMKDIDEMDMIGYFRVRAWKARSDKKENEPKRVRYIDEIEGL